MKIMVIEDDSNISFAIKTFLQKHNMETIIFNNLNSTENVNIKDFDLIILDVNLPDGSGFDFLKWIRDFSNIPVIILTVKGDENYILNGFSIGADEYIIKPFSLPILKARIDNVLKRNKLNCKEIIFYDLHLDLISKNARIGNENLNLNKQEFAVLEILLENKNINLYRDKIINSVWGYDIYEINDNTLTVTIKRLRNKLKNYGGFIKTVRGIGYKWESE